jgi:hypothetical protein
MHENHPQNVESAIQHAKDLLQLLQGNGTGGRLTDGAEELRSWLEALRREIDISLGDSKEPIVAGRPPDEGAYARPEHRV